MLARGQVEAQISLDERDIIVLVYLLAVYLDRPALVIGDRGVENAIFRRLDGAGDAAAAEDDDTIAQDYLLTNELYDFAVSKQYPDENQIAKLVSKMNLTKGEGPAIRGITETIRKGWGSFDNFFKKELGFSQKDLDRFRKMYLE